MLFFFVKQKTAYEMRISDWSSDVCSSDLLAREGPGTRVRGAAPAGSQMRHRRTDAPRQHPLCIAGVWRNLNVGGFRGAPRRERAGASGSPARHALRRDPQLGPASRRGRYEEDAGRSEEHTSELQSLMRHSYAVF